MKLRGIGNLIGGLAFLWGAWFIFSSGRVLGRGGFTSLTQEASPGLFWLEVGAFAVCGLLLIAHGLAHRLGLTGFTIRADRIANRVSGSMLHIYAVVLGAIALLLLGSMGWLVYSELLAQK
jgi:hypothetical protein